MSQYISKPYYISQGTNSGDIFSFFRKSFNSADLDSDEIVSITSSSQTVSSLNNITNVSCLIRENTFDRFVSLVEPNPNITIDFHSNRITLLSYEILTSRNFRFIKNWDLYGIRGSRKILVDSVRENDKFTAIENQCGCIDNSLASFTCKHPGTFSKFVLINTGADSCGDNQLSLSRIMFYGAVNMKRGTCQRKSNTFTSLFSAIIFVIL